MGVPMVLILLELLPLAILLALLPMLVITLAIAVHSVWFPALPAIAVAAVVTAVLAVQFESCPSSPEMLVIMWHLLDLHLLVLGDASLDLVVLKLSPAVLPAPLPTLSTTIEMIVMIHCSIVTDVHLN